MSKKNIKNLIELELNKLTNELSNKLESCRIDVLENIPSPEIAWEIKDDHSEEFNILGTHGNFSLVKGKAKSKKSFFINMAISAAVGEGILQNKLRGPLKEILNQVLYFDTEQSKYHVQKAVKRICRQIKVDMPNNLTTYGLRKSSPSERLKLVEHAIETTANLGFVVIDGIRDLITSINDEAESTNMASKLLEWTERYNIHIVVILHENPGSDKARGHIGTELTNKAETVITVQIDKNNKDVSVVSAGFCRNESFKSFAFEIYDDLPVIIHDYEITSQSSRKNTIDLLSFSKEENSEILNMAFETQNKLMYTELAIRLKNAVKALKSCKNGPGNNKIKDYISYLKEHNILNQEGDRKPYTINKPSV